MQNVEDMGYSYDIKSFMAVLLIFNSIEFFERMAHCILTLKNTKYYQRNFYAKNEYLFVRRM